MASKKLSDYLSEFPNFLALFIYSFFVGAISPILLDIGTFLNADPQDVNTATSFFMVGTVLGILLTVLTNKYFKKSFSVLGSYILLIPVIVFLSFVKTLIIFQILYGLGGLFLGITWIQSNNRMVEGRVKNKDSVVNLGHAFFALGALISPFISSYLLESTGEWRHIYYVILGMVSVAIILYVLVLKTEKVKIKILEKTIHPKKAFSRGKTVFLVLTAAMLVFNMISQTIIFSWSPTFFRIMKAFSIYEAGLILSVFWIGVMVGRLLISFLAYKVNTDIILMGLCIITIFSIMVSVFSNSKATLFIGIGSTGLGFSGVVPLAISTGTSIFKKRKDTVLVILFSLGVLGNAAGPYIARVFADKDLNLSILIAAIIVFISLIFVITRAVSKKYIPDIVEQ